MPHEPNVWHVGDVNITRIVEHEVDSHDPALVIGGLTHDEVRSVEWLYPEYANADGSMKSSIHAFVVESCGIRIIVDTCIGNDKPRAVSQWNMTQIPFLERLAAAGFSPESIDIVLCTHLHVDHVGWNTRWDGNAWIPTFPNARYLFGRVEWEHWSNPHTDGDVPAEVATLIETDQVIEDSVTPIVAAGLHVLVETDHRVTAEVGLTPTPGHTPGHVSVVISSLGQSAVITGDLAHHPIQFARPELCSNFDNDRDTSQSTRQAFVLAHSDTATLILGTHFPEPAGGRIAKDGSSWRFDPPRD